LGHWKKRKRRNISNHRGKVKKKENLINFATVLREIKLLRYSIQPFAKEVVKIS
jgi:hypothetical protein